MKYKKIIVLAAALGITLIGHAGANCNFEYTRTLEETHELAFDQSMNHQEVIVDLFVGKIDVEGYDGDKVILEVKRTTKARSETRLDLAEQEEWLEIKEEGDAVLIYSEGPYRSCKNGDRGVMGISYKGCHFYGYESNFDLTLRVPEKSKIRLKSVLGGGIYTKGIEGDFDVHAVKGSVSLQSMSGSGRARSVSGKVLVEFTEPPEAACSFRSINGKIDVRFPTDLNADFVFKMKHGKVYTDFDAESLELDAELFGNSAERGDMRVFKTTAFRGARVGDGGPRHKFETINGSIHILKLDTNS